MIQLALLVLAPLLGLTIANRRVIVGILTGAWAVLMIPQTHVVVLDGPSTTRARRAAATGRQGTLVAQR